MRRVLLALMLLVTGLLAGCEAGEHDDYEGYDGYGEETADPPVDGANDERPSSGALPAGWESNFAGYVAGVQEEQHIPGIALALVQGSKTVLVQGYGLRDVDAGLPVTADTLFHIGSTHKSMNAMLIATLVDEGLFDWDTPVVEIYPDFALADPDATATVTIRHLLSMRSGIPDYAEDDFDIIDTAGVFELAARAELLGEPGEEFSYSNPSAALAGYLGVLAAGGDLTSLFDDYAQLMRENVLAPIGMNQATLYASQARQSPDIARSYTISDSQIVLTDSYDLDGDPLAPAGSLKAGAAEMALYISTQLNQGVAPNGKRVVSAENLQETWRPYLEDYGMGWEIVDYNGVRLIVHTGSYDSFASVIAFMPNLDVGLVILTNSEEAAGDFVDEAPYVLVDLLVGE